MIERKGDGLGLCTCEAAVDLDGRTDSREKGGIKICQSRVQVSGIGHASNEKVCQLREIQNFLFARRSLADSVEQSLLTYSKCLFPGVRR